MSQKHPERRNLASARDFVLVIDDDRLTRTALADLLGRAGFEVSLAEDGHSGLEQTRRRRPDFVLCDWIMPRMDGLEYCRRVRSDPELCDLPITILTGRGEPGERLACIDAGADDVLVKPTEPDELLTRVREGVSKDRPGGRESVAPARRRSD